MKRFLGFLFALSATGVLVGIAGLYYLLNFWGGGELPDYRSLADYEPPTVTRIHAADGRLLAEYASERRVFVPIEAIPNQVTQAFLSAEDKTFYEHPGLDFTGIARAIITNLENLSRDRRPVGASTITQQVAKNFLLDNEVSIMRKLKEAILAIRIEQALSKDRILELYLNEIFLGSRSYGVAAAALNYFNKALEELTLAEAAYLAALPKAPNNYHPERNLEAALARRNWVIGRMAEDGHVGAEEARAAMDEPIVLHQRDETEVVDAEYFAEEVRREIVKMFDEATLYEGGLTVRATVDPTLQALATRVLRDGLMRYDRKYGWRGPITKFETLDDWAKQLQGLTRLAGTEGWDMAVVLDTSDRNAADIGLPDGTRGRVPMDEIGWARRINAQGRAGRTPRRPSQAFEVGEVILVERIGPAESADDDAELTYTLRQVPEIQGGMVAIDVHTGRVLAMAGGFSPQISVFNRATQALRQPGSAFKPFVYLTALNNGFTPSSLVMDAPFAHDPGAGQPIWRPQNYSHEFYGPTPLRVGVEKSRNVMTVRLAHHIGMDKVKATAETFGIFDTMEPYLPMALGAGETTVLRLVSAYAMLANGGKRIDPSFIDRIQDRDGRTIYKHDQRPCRRCEAIHWSSDLQAPEIPDVREQIADPRTVYQIVSILEGVTKRGTAARLSRLGRTLAGKTGTTNDAKDAWFVGFDPDLAVGLYVGYDQPRPLGRGATGGGLAAPIFQAFMAEALEGKPDKPFRVPPGVRLVRVDPSTGSLAAPGARRVIWEAFLPGTEPYGPRTVLDGSIDGAGFADSSFVDPYGGEASSSVNSFTRPSSTTMGTGGLY